VRSRFYDVVTSVGGLVTVYGDDMVLQDSHVCIYMGGYMVAAFFNPASVTSRVDQ
jgi:hypothetical protein